MSNAFARIAELKRQLQQTVQEEGGKILLEELKKTLDLMPEVEAIVWYQNHNVYNDENYTFRSSGFGIIPVKDCPWRDAYIKSLSEIYDDDVDESVLKNPRCYPEMGYCLSEVADVMPEHATRLAFIRNTLSDLDRFVPKEVLETFADVAARATRNGISFEDFDYER
jgi:hypothetical protein